MKKKKIILIVVAVLFALVLVFFGYQVYTYYHPECGFRIAAPLNNADMYVEQLTFYINEKSMFGAPKEIYEKSSEVLDGWGLQYQEMLEKYTGPMHVNVSLKVEKGQTIVITEGIGIDKATGKEADILYKKIFDFVVG